MVSVKMYRRWNKHGGAGGARVARLFRPIYNMGNGTEGFFYCAPSLSNAPIQIGYSCNRFLVPSFYDHGYLARY